MNVFIVISTICVSAMLSHAADDYAITINGTRFDIEFDTKKKITLPISTPANTRFVTCENCAGAGFYWVDTTCGAVWWASPEETTWIYFGAPAPSSRGQNGRFIPYQNKSGDGLFILDTDRGEGWWANGKQWKKMGRPAKSLNEGG
ncbi:MAG: hypothetical protein DRP64_16160 [Verrucomicrobia bacterium]|nr:MAG: hypothetical protein DRP64_16160 [Verrucomicrobiota bacterium]